MPRDECGDRAEPSGSRLMHQPRPPSSRRSAAFYRVALHHRMPVRVRPAHLDAERRGMRVPRGTVVRARARSAVGPPSGSRRRDRTAARDPVPARRRLHRRLGAALPRTARRTCAGRAEAVVFNLDYRLAPEHSLPGGTRGRGCGLPRAGRRARLRPRGHRHRRRLGRRRAQRRRRRDVLTDAGAATGRPRAALTVDRSRGRAVHEQRDRVTNVAWGRAAPRYRGSADPTDPGYAPMHGSLDGLPPMLIHCSTVEMLYPQIERFAEKAQRGGRRRGVRRARGLVAQHSRARRALARSDRRRHDVGAFLRHHLAGRLTSLRAS